MNLRVYREKELINQLAYWKRQGRLEIEAGEGKLETMTNYNDVSASLENRARAYLNINCAHCHNPQGIASITQLDLRAGTALFDTGLLLKQGKVALRMTVPGELHMPKIGTTLQHEEGIRLVLEYINSLNDKSTGAKTKVPVMK